MERYLKLNVKKMKNEEEETKDDREICKYGSGCYQKNPAHRARFQHPKRSPDKPLQNPPDKKAKLENVQSGYTISDSEDDENDNNSSTCKGADTSVSIISQDVSFDTSKASSLDSSIASKGVPQTSSAISVNKESQDIFSSGSSEKATHEVSSFNTSTEAPSSGSYSSKVSDNSSNGEEMIVVSRLTGSHQNKLKQLYVVEFPRDLFSFYEYCKSVYLKSPKTSLRDIGLELVGPFDYLSGDIKCCTLTQIMRHQRYYYDPPEYYTILRSINSEFHYGYFYDEPDKPPVFVASNDPKKGCKITIVAENIFGAVNNHINSCLKSSDPFKKVKIQKIQNSLMKWAKEKEISLYTNSPTMKARNNKSVTKTFHGAGLVVPVDKKTDVGYRPLAVNNEKLKELFQMIAECENESERKARWSKLQHVITYAEIAVDECDFGTSLELGMNMFCQGHPTFHRAAVQLMSTVYGLLGRDHFAEVIKAHLENRLRGRDLNFASSPFFSQEY